MSLALVRHDPVSPKDALAAEWRAANPQTPEQIAHFYRTARTLEADLAAWHAEPARAEVTRQLAYVAKQAAVTTVVDIGAGAGHDLAAIQVACPEARLVAVEPNLHLGALLPSSFEHVAEVAAAPIEEATLLVCIDVLEHVVDPEGFLASIAQRAPAGCLLFETTATCDTTTPLHLRANRGWHPGRCLETSGWECVDRSARVRVWKRLRTSARERAGLLLCAYRSLSADTFASILDLTADTRGGWRVRCKAGDALIARSRSIIATAWWRETADDVFLMVDDDIVFSRADADRMVELCRHGHDVICGAYPVHNGAHFACRLLPGRTQVAFGPGQPPFEIAYPATGFMAVHRRVLDALIAALPLCHASEEWSFYPLFAGCVRTPEDGGDTEWLSEDYGFGQLAHDAGFAIWLDPQVRLQHIGAAAISVTNMAAMKAAIEQL
jgi:hypothetical protein